MHVNNIDEDGYAHSRGPVVAGLDSVDPHATRSDEEKRAVVSKF